MQDSMNGMGNGLKLGVTDIIRNCNQVLGVKAFNSISQAVIKVSIKCVKKGKGEHKTL